MRIRTAFRLSLIIALVAAPAAISDTYSCNQPDEGQCCLYNATCTGDFYQFVEPCKIQCYVYGGDPGEIISAGSATCTPITVCP